MKILDCGNTSVIFWKIQSCNKKYLFPKWLVDLFDVGTVVPNKGEPIPYMGFTRRIYDRSSKTLDTRSFKLWNENEFLVHKVSDKFSTSFVQVR